MNQILVTTLLAVLPFAANAQQLTYERIARSNDLVNFPVPGNDTPFQSFNAPTTDGENVVFWASNTSQAEGIYLWDGSQLLRIADRDSKPDGKTITNFQQEPTVIFGKVTFGAFRGGNSSFTGVYEAEAEIEAEAGMDPSAFKVFDSDTPLSSELGDKPFELFPKSISNGSTTVIQITHFQPDGENFGQKHTGIFDRQPGELNDNLQVVLHPEYEDEPLKGNVIKELSSFDDNTFGVLLEFQDPGTFETIRRVAAFHYFDYAIGQGHLEILASEGDSPNVLQGDSFTQLFAPTISAGHAAYVATYSTGSGIIIEKASPTSLGPLKIVDTNTTVPGTAFKFAAFDSMLAYERRLVPVDTEEFPNFSGRTYLSETVVFSATIDDGIFFNRGLFMWQNGVLSALVMPEDVIGGTSRIHPSFSTSFVLSTRSLLNGRLTFKLDDAYNQSTGQGVDEIFTTLIPQAPFTGGFPPGTTSYNAVSGMAFNFEGIVDQSYTVEYSDGLPSNWMTLTNFTYTAPITITDPSTLPTQRIYRTVSP